MGGVYKKVIFIPKKPEWITWKITFIYFPQKIH